MKVKDLLANKDRWCQGADAYDDSDEIVDPTSGRACRWCLSGAIQRCYKGTGHAEEMAQRLAVVCAKIEREELPELGEPVIDDPMDFLVDFNDDALRTYEQILTACIEADI